MLAQLPIQLEFQVSQKMISLFVSVWSLVIETAKIVHRCLKVHFRTLQHDLDPVRDCALYGIDEQKLLLNTRQPTTYQILNVETRKRENFQLNQNFLPPFILFSYFLLDSLWVFAQADFRYSPSAMPELITHLTYLPAYWAQGDCIMGPSLFISLAVSGSLVVQAPIEDRYLMYLIMGSNSNAPMQQSDIKMIQNHQIMPAQVVTDICKFRHKARRLFRRLAPVMFVEVCGFTLVNFSLNWQGTLRHYFMAVLIPPMDFYLLFSNYVFFSLPKFNNKNLMELILNSFFLLPLNSYYLYDILLRDYRAIHLHQTTIYICKTD